MEALAFNEKMWFAIAEPSRRRLIELLLHQGEASATALASKVPFSRQAVAKHMAVLKKAGLVTEHRAGREMLFGIDKQGISDASKELSRAAQAWDARLHKIKQIAEAMDSVKNER